MNDRDNAGTSSRARGCLLGQLAGDALGSQVEFQPTVEIARKYPSGVRNMRDGGMWNTLAGQPTDDSEMALLLARLLVRNGSYDTSAARSEYRWWLLDSLPFDVGNTIRAALQGRPTATSQANGALMRLSPLGIFGANLPLEQTAQFARLDSQITHPHSVCCEANAIFAMALATAIREETRTDALYSRVVEWAGEPGVPESVRRCVLDAANGRPRDYLTQQGWVLIALQNALYQLLNAPNAEEAIVDTVMQGGDTDTNAAIAGALVGAVYGSGAIPERWTRSILACRPEAGLPGVMRPRPVVLWPTDALELADGLLTAAR